MKSRQLTPKYVLAVAVGLLLVSSFLPARWLAGPGAFLHDCVYVLLQPTTHYLTLMSNSLRAPRTPTGLRPGEDIDQLRQAHKNLVQYVHQLEQELQRARAEIAKLSQVTRVESVELGRAEPRVANVTGVSDAGAAPLLWINCGSRQRVTPHCVVVNGDNLVGVTAQVEPVTSAVQLITTPRRSLGVKVMPPGARTAKDVGLSIAVADGQEFHITTEVRVTAKVGDVARLYDESFPPEAAGFVIGQVTEIRESPRDRLRTDIVIRPIEPLKTLSRVVVLIPPETPESPERPARSDRPENPRRR